MEEWSEQNQIFDHSTNQQNAVLSCDFIRAVQNQNGCGVKAAVAMPTIEQADIRTICVVPFQIFFSPFQGGLTKFFNTYRCHF